MRNINRVFYLIVILTLFGMTSLLAQSGTIRGTVIDSLTQEPLIGVNVGIEGTNLGAATDVEGNYIINRVPVGVNTIEASSIGYQKFTTEVNIADGEVLELNIVIKQVTVQGEDVVISAQAQGQRSAINEQLSSNTITSVVSAEKIQDIPDINAAESVGRLSGVSVLRSGGEGQKVTIRGLSPQYNVIMVNGVRVQSTDRNNRSVDLNMVAPNVLSGISVTKALTADMDADAVGGTVNLRIGKAKKGLKGDFSLQNGYASMANTPDEAFVNYRFSGAISNRVFNDKLGIQLSGYIDDHNRNADVLGAGWPVERETSPDGVIPIELGSASITDRITDRQRAGGSLVLDYKFKNGSLIFNNFVSKVQDDQVIHANSFTTSLGWNGNARENYNSNTVINNALQGDFDFGALRMDFSLSNSISRQESNTLRLSMRTVVGNAQALTSEFADSLFTFTPSMFMQSVEFISEDQILQDLRTTTRDVESVGQAAALNFTAPFKITENLSGNLRFGGKYEFNTREQDEGVDFINLITGELTNEYVNYLKANWPELGIPADRSRIPAQTVEDQNYEVPNFLSGNEGISGDRFHNLVDIDMMNNLEQLAIEAGYYSGDPLGSNAFDYNYRRDFQAYYVSGEINVGEYITLLPGLRYESFNFDYTADSTTIFGRLTEAGEEFFRSETINIDDIGEENWFPQLQVQIKPTDWFDLRLARTESIIYPDFRAISPFVLLDIFGDPVLRLGNPSLVPATSENYDIYASVYENHIGLFTVGVFSKNIDDFIVPIEYLTKDASVINNRLSLNQSGKPTVINTWTNLDETSRVRGIEFEWQTNFWYLPPLFQGLVFNINFTRINSETFYPRYFTRREGTFPNFVTTTVDTVRSGRLINQPDNILNMTIGYDLGGFSTRLSYQYTDNILRGVDATYPQRDSYTAPFNRWDLSARQKFSKLEGFEVFMNVNNITNMPDRQLQSTRRLLRNVEYYGRIVTLGARYKF